MQREPACLEDVGQAQERRAGRTGTRPGRRRPRARRLKGLAPEPNPVDLTTLSTAELAQQCAAEQDHYRQRLPVDERAGLELFWRAIQQRDELAWELIYCQWKGLLMHWLLKHPSAALVLEQEPPENFITVALEKFWQATTHANRSQQDFATLADILSYLRRCLNSVMLDAVRQIRARQYERYEEAASEVAFSQPLETPGGELWCCIERALPDRRERRLIYLRYVLGYQPREIVAVYSQDFTKVEQVYQLERSILRRLSRHPALARWKE